MVIIGVVLAAFAPGEVISKCGIIGVNGYFSVRFGVVGCLVAVDVCGSFVGSFSGSFVGSFGC
jgi:hypothetical protein